MIPTRNRWGSLTSLALPSAASQRGVDCEIIVVDDGSDDRPGERELGVIEQSGARVVELDHRRGVAAARNAGIAQAGGDWVALLDDDDVWAPDKLLRVVEQAEASDADFGYSSVLVVDSSRRPKYEVKAVAPAALPDEVMRSNGVVAIASNVVAKLSLLEDVGSFDEGFSTAADWELLVRLVAAGRGSAVPEPLVAYRASGWMYRDEALHRGDLERLRSKHPSVEIDWCAFERTVALGLHRDGYRLQAARRYLAAAKRYRSARCLILAATAPIDRAAIDRARHGPAPAMPQWLAPSQ